MGNFVNSRDPNQTFCKYFSHFPPGQSQSHSLPLIQEGQLSVSGERMCTILVNRLED